MNMILTAPPRLPAKLPVVRPEVVRAEMAAYDEWVAAETAKPFRLRTQFGSSRYATMEAAEAFAATLSEPYFIEQA